MKTDEALLAEAREVLGEEYQFNVTVEELSCLITSLVKYNRGRCTRLEFIEALADADLMIEQIIYNHRAEAEIDAIKNVKLSDLRRTIEVAREKSK